MHISRVAMQLSAEAVRAFFEQGWVVLPALFGGQEVAMVRAAFERLYTTSQALRVTQEHAGAFFVLGEGAAGAPIVVKRVVWAGGAEPSLLELSADSRLVTPALQLLGTQRCEQLLCQAHFKMPNDGVAFDWHQDIQHRDKGPGTWTDVNGRGSYVQSLLLVDDMRPDNGPLQFIPQDAVLLDDKGRLPPGHDDYSGPVRAAGTMLPIDISKAVTITGNAGDVLLFGPYAVHGSMANTSALPRRVLINGYAAPGANGRTYPGVGSCRTLPIVPTGR